jgi:hypothetical protein
MRLELRQIALALLLGSVGGVAAAAQAGEGERPLRASLTAGATYSDNAGRTDTNEESETILELGVVFGADYERERLTADVAADLQFRSHQYRDFGSGVDGGLQGMLTYALMRDRLLWVIEDNFAQALIDSRNVATPDNTQDLNYLSTGPDIRLPLGTRTGVLLQGRWSNVSYEAGDYGNERLLGVVGLMRQLGDTSTVSLHGSTEHVEYTDLAAASDYIIRSAYLMLQAEGARTTLNLRAGLSELREQQESSGGVLIGLEVMRRMSARSVFSVHAGRSFGDSADALRRDQGIRGVAIGDRPAAVASDPLRADHLTLAWDNNGARSGVHLSANWRREAHQRDTTLDRRHLNGELQLTRRFSPRLGIAFNTGYTREEFQTAAIDFDEWGAGLSMTWSWNPALNLQMGWEHLVGSGDTVLGAGTRDYRENRLTLRLGYNPTF